MNAQPLSGVGRKTVAAAGTAERLLAASTPCRWVTVSPLPSNTGVVAIGNASVLATAGATSGIVLPTSAAPVRVPCNDVHDLFVDARTSTEGVAFAWG